MLTVAESGHAAMPPREAGTGRAFALALLVHVLLIAVLAIGVQWQSSPPLGAEAELWDEAESLAALGKPPEPERPGTPEPAAEPVVPPAPSPRPAPVASDDDAEIALKARRKEQEAAEALRLRAAREREERLREEKRQAEREKQAQAEQKRRERAKLEEARAEREKAVRAEKEKAQREKIANERLAKEKAAQDRAATEKAARDALAKERLAREKAAADKASAAKAAAEKAAAEKAARDRAEQEKAREEQLARLRNAAGTGGSGGAQGAASGGGPSSGYAEKIRRRVEQYLDYRSQAPEGGLTAVVLVRLAPDGEVASRRLVRTSGSSEWDQAVLRALDEASPLPRDIDGTVPRQVLSEGIRITFRLKN